MDGVKLIKDPIYGYIHIPEDLVEKIIDSNTFQRLRRIIQTSYAPLYPSSTHNRFAHSLGVYYLGKIAAQHIVLQLKNIFPDEDWERKEKIFCLACLLHDVGHAPFSHTGENYFLDDTLDARNTKKRYEKIHNLLVDLVGSEGFKKDIPIESGAAAPHEIMSAIVGLSNFPSFFEDQSDKEFFSRCITGYKYSDDYGINSAYNCFVASLNSNVIDVDRLDYLIRDAYFTGFETINLDYIRLLTAVTIVEKEITIEDREETQYIIGYKKNAISIIENVVYAHDSEKKWIQSHPTILYDMYIIQHIINELDKIIRAKGCSLFSLESLSSQGIEIPSLGKISLLCDDDIVFLLKNLLSDELSGEFFSRNTRRHPLWKSNAEFKAYFELKFGRGNVLDNLELAFEATEKYLKSNSDSWIINEDVVRKLQEELTKIKEDTNPQVDEISRKRQIETKERILKLLKGIQDYANSCGCNFVLLKASQFYSGFNKNDFDKIPIVFDKLKDKQDFDFSKVVDTLNSKKEKPKDEFFYLYFKEENIKKFEKEAFFNNLYKIFM